MCVRELVKLSVQVSVKVIIKLSDNVEVMSIDEY